MAIKRLERECVAKNVMLCEERVADKRLIRQMQQMQMERDMQDSILKVSLLFSFLI